MDAAELTAFDQAGLSRLGRELADNESANRFAPVLSITRATVASTPTGQCADCCHWSLPLSTPYTDRQTAHGAALHFNEWLVYHWHIANHQHWPERIAASAGVLVA